MRKLNALSEKKIKQWENGGNGAPKLTAYRDSGGVWTIGTGHTGTVDGVRIGKGMKITAAKAQELFEHDIAWAIRAVERLIKVKLNDNQFGALVSFTLNLGEGALEKSTLRKKLNRGDYASVPHELMKWVKDQDPKTKKLVTVQGLVNRRAAECGLWATDSYVSSAVSSSAPSEVQPVKTSSHTRDVVTTSVVGGLGTVSLGVKPISDIVETIQTQQDALSGGSIAAMIVAGIIVAGTIYVIVRKARADV